MNTSNIVIQGEAGNKGASTAIRQNEVLFRAGFRCQHKLDLVNAQMVRVGEALWFSQTLKMMADINN